MHLYRHPCWVAKYTLQKNIMKQMEGGSAILCVIYKRISVFNESLVIENAKHFYNPGEPESNSLMFVLQHSHYALVSMLL